MRGGVYIIRDRFIIPQDSHLQCSLDQPVHTVVSLFALLKEH